MLEYEIIEKYKAGVSKYKSFRKKIIEVLKSESPDGKTITGENLGNILTGKYTRLSAKQKEWLVKANDAMDKVMASMK